jgi:hypothetical protein
MWGGMKTIESSAMGQTATTGCGFTIAIAPRSRFGLVVP